MSSIHDLYTRQLDSQTSQDEQVWTVLQYDDHLLRRFGLAEVIRSEQAEFGHFRVREVADEVWAILEGKAEFLLRDFRETSPTQGLEQIIHCDRPTLCLVPFGVGFAYRSVEGVCLLARLATHADSEHAGDRTIQAGEL
jgi:mannose-6-phosphate isomerase-like protein (cupin superfamily)